VTQKYFQNINSLRAVACITVILFHSDIERILRENKLFNPFKSGAYGVDLFFVLSGFLITTILFREYSNTSTINIVNFYKRRLLRLYPPIVIAVSVFLVPYLFFNFRTAISNIFFTITYTGDVVMLFRYLIPYFEYPLIFGHCWSLAIEEQYYLFFPVTFLILLKYLTRKKKADFVSTFIIFNVLFVLLIVISTIILQSHFYKFFLWRFFEIFFGVYVALIFSNEYNANFTESRTGQAVVNFIEYSFSSKFALFLSILLFFYFVSTGGFSIPYNLNYYAFTIISSVLIVHAAFDYSNYFSNILSNKVLRYFGKISYGMYLYHFPIFKFYHILNFPKATTLSGAILVECLRIPVIIIFSILSYELVEKPILKLKAKYY
jgi:peptidoglycan/LPS O-acetylase OafA/YrhL